VERIALISDVHGNLTALEAVFADIDRRGISRIFNLGDYVGKGPRGREVVDLCRERCEVNLLGNWDDFLPDPDRQFDSEALQWWLADLGPGQGDWLRGLAFNHDFWLSGRRVRLFHASEETVHRRVRYVRSQAEFEALFTNTPATGDGPLPDVVGYGDTHDPFYECQLEGRTSFNTGSVGNCMGDPTPLYCILEGRSTPKILRRGRSPTSAFPTTWRGSWQQRVSSACRSTTDTSSSCGTGSTAASSRRSARANP
jgi:predicted phosphodiesterase